MAKAYITKNIMCSQFSYWSTLSPPISDWPRFPVFLAAFVSTVEADIFHWPASNARTVNVVAQIFPQRFKSPQRNHLPSFWTACSKTHFFSSSRQPIALARNSFGLCHTHTNNYTHINSSCLRQSEMVGPVFMLFSQPCNNIRGGMIYFKGLQHIFTPQLFVAESDEVSTRQSSLSLVESMEPPAIFRENTTLAVMSGVAELN